MVTPMAAPTSTSVGASAPSAIRPSPVSATSPAASHLPRLRERPSGTSEYRIATSPAAKKVTGRDGSAQPPQPALITTPNGRGRCRCEPIRVVATNASKFTAMIQMIRCRKRRNASSASSSPYAIEFRTHHELSAASACQNPTSPGT
jgi:hypothetical protein